jgi:hypothetical protein
VRQRLSVQSVDGIGVSAGWFWCYGLLLVLLLLLALLLQTLPRHHLGASRAEAGGGHADWHNWRIWHTD